MSMEEENFSDDGFDDWGDDSAGGTPQLTPQHSETTNIKGNRSFAILSAEDVDQRIKAKVDEVKDVLGLTYEETLIILRRFKWNDAHLQELWFENESKAREMAGISQKKGKKEAAESLKNLVPEGGCGVCCAEKAPGDFFGLDCKHMFCNDCWGDFLNSIIQSGKSSIETTCPYYGCPFTVTESAFKQFLQPENFEIYKRYLRLSFVDENKAASWCPRPGCEFCVEYPSRSSKDVECTCGFLFCFSCSRESHRPCTCEGVNEWQEKNANEEENVTWILANTKQCPKCRKPIEKNQGCNHMTCQKHAGGCGHDFCWMCLGPWGDHGSNTGGYYKCNKYEKVMSEGGSLQQQEKERLDAKSELDKYMFYFERFNNHHKAKGIAEKQAPLVEKKIQQLHDLKNYPVGELQFLKDAFKVVIECRRVLMYTYTFGFYLENGKEKELFEYLQEKLEENCDHLHELLEKPLDPFLDPDQMDRSPFYQFKGELTNYAQVTTQFFNNLLEGVENGLTNNTL